METGMNPELGRRIGVLVEASGVAQKDFAAKVEVTKEYLNSVIRGRKPAGRKFVVKVAKALGIPAQELLKYYDEDYTSGCSVLTASSSLHADADVERQSFTHGDFTHVPYLEATLAGSNGESVELDTSVRSYLSFQTPWLASKGSPRQMAAMRVVGDSMEPKIPDGAVVLVRVAKADTFSSGAIYAVSYDQGLNIKRLSRDEEDRWVLSSDNPSYPPKVVKEGDHFEIIGRVVWVCFDV